MKTDSAIFKYIKERPNQDQIHYRETWLHSNALRRDLALLKYNKKRQRELSSGSAM